MEEKKTLEALQLAVRMEIDGKEFYLKSSREAGNKLGKELFESLAAEEDKHRARFEKIYETMADRKSWPQVDFTPDKGKHLRTLFGEEIKKLGSTIKPASSELEAVQSAMKMEDKSMVLYEKRAGETNLDAEKEFFKMIAGEERGHYLVLENYYEYLVNPAGWMTISERHSLDGG
jgi:rubrerythrin